MSEPTEDATIVDRAAPTRTDGAGPPHDGDGSAGTPASTGGSSGELAVTSVLTSATVSVAMREEQGARAKAFLRLACLVSLLTLGGINTTAHRAPGYLLASACFVLTSVLAIVILVGARRSPAVGATKMNLFGVVCGVTILTASYHLGLFSPVLIPMFVGVYFFGLGDSRLGAWAIFLMAVFGWGGMAALDVAGALPRVDRVFGLGAPEAAPLVATIIVVEAFFALTFWLALTSRRAALQAMHRIERAQRQIRQRDALLDEAKADLDRAMEVGRVGRLTDQDVGSFVTGKVIGRGAMGEVYEARHRKTGHPAALKVLHQYMVEDEKHVERFFREVETSSSASSKHVVRVLESGTAEDGSPYLAMELLEGHDLAHQLRQRRRLSIRAIVQLVTEVAAGLGAVHEAGVIHRDLKPQNLFRAKGRGRGHVWKILDFGVATMTSTSGTLTQGAAIGTPSYMAPEQARGSRVDERADVFALGVITYRALTGRPAFTAPDSMATMYNVVHVQPVRPGELVKVPRDIDRVLALALAKSTDRRLSSASTFAASFRDAARESLDPRFREDADELIASHPWGTDDTELPRAAE